MAGASFPARHRTAWTRMVDVGSGVRGVPGCIRGVYTGLYTGTDTAFTPFYRFYPFPAAKTDPFTFTFPLTPHEPFIIFIYFSARRYTGDTELVEIKTVTLTPRCDRGVNVTARGVIYSCFMLAGA